LEAALSTTLVAASVVPTALLTPPIFAAMSCTLAAAVCGRFPGGGVLLFDRRRDQG
jgi:hypothetical protein